MKTQFARAQKGEPAAVAAVVAHLRPRLTRMAGYYARCASENADDLLQEAWLGLRTPCATSTWRSAAPNSI